MFAGALQHESELTKTPLPQDNPGEFTFYSATVAACEICRAERDRYCEADDIWFWAERRQWPGPSGRLRALPVFLPWDLELGSGTRWVGGQPVTVYFGNKKTQTRVARWITEQMDKADGTRKAFDPPYFVDTSTCAQSHFYGFRLMVNQDKQ